MKKLFLISAALLAAISSAQSADMPRAYTKAPMAPVSSWTGFYAGLNAGYAWQDPSVSFSPNDVVARTATTPGGFFSDSTPIPPASYDIKGAVYGGQLGYNSQIDKQWLLGAEIDFQGASIKGTGTSNFNLAARPSSTTSEQKVDWFGTVRARIGYLPTDKLLVYGTGGFAYGQVKENSSIISDSTANFFTSPFGFNCAGHPVCFTGSSSRIATGWTVGAGFEYALLQNITLKLEYLYVDLGSNNVNVISTAPSAFSPTSSSSFNAAFSDLSFNVVRAGINYRF